MKILLVNPRSVEDAIHKSVPLNPYVPYGLLYLGAVLEKSKHSVKILDRNAEGKEPEGVLQYACEEI